MVHFSSLNDKVKDGAGQNSIGQVKFFFVIFLD
jgi:hypothetical protein